MYWYCRRTKLEVQENENKSVKIKSILTINLTSAETNKAEISDPHVLAKYCRIWTTQEEVLIRYCENIRKYWLPAFSHFSIFTKGFLYKVVTNLNYKVND